MKKLEHSLKRRAYSIARAMLDNRACHIEPGDLGRDMGLERIRRVIVVRQDRRLGNLVMVTSLISGLRRILPEAQLELVAPAAFTAVLQGLTELDRVIPVDHRRLIQRPWDLGRLRSALRADARADIVIDASQPHSFSFSSGMVCAVSGARHRLGYDRGQADAFLDRLLTPPETFEGHEHAMLHRLTIGLVAEPGPAPEPRLALLDDEVGAAERAVERWQLNDRVIVGMHPGAKSWKLWPTARFEETACLLEEAGRGVVVFCGPGERPLLDLMGPPSPSRVYVAGPTLRGFMALVSRCSTFVSADCGPMHLAAALGVRSVSIFRVDNHRRYAPPGARHRVFFDPDGGVSAEAVAAAVLETS